MGLAALIFNIRGTNGSGKSTVVRHFLPGARPIYGLLGARDPEAYLCNLPWLKDNLYVLGPYRNRIGGCDRIRPFDNILTLLDKYAPRGHIMFEGVLVSDNYGRVGEWLESKGSASVVVFLDTPLEVCVERVKARTDKPGTQHMERKFKEILKVRGWFLENGKLRVVDASSETAPVVITELLNAPGVG